METTNTKERSRPATLADHEQRRCGCPKQRVKTSEGGFRLALSCRIEGTPEHAVVERLRAAKLGKQGASPEEIAKRNGWAWSPRCTCRRGHGREEGGQCSTLDVTDPSQPAGENAVCLVCRQSCALMEL